MYILTYYMYIYNIYEAFKITFILQYGKVLSIEIRNHFFISNDFLLRNGKTQTNSFFGTIQISWCLINTLYKCIFIQQLTKLLLYPITPKKMFKF